MTCELSCYTTALVSYLDTVEPGGHAADRLADATRLAVRCDAEGVWAFSHHRRVDGGLLSYHDGTCWDRVHASLRDELAAVGAAIAVANTARLPWSPHHDAQQLPHWIVLRDYRAGRWWAADDFSAVMPAGTQQPFHGWLTDDQLRTALSPVGALPRHVANRDTHALGVAVPIGSTANIRWLHRATAPQGPPGPQELGSGWCTDPVAVLSLLAEKLCDHQESLHRHTDDLWAAARHQCHHADRLAATGRLAPQKAHRLRTAWSQLPRALRFAAESAARGRPRFGVARKAFDELIGTVKTSGEAS